ncbi:unnamed protein product, partial [Ilex paraguariensis]
MRGGHVMYRRGPVCILEMYNPHHFTRQHGFHQRLPSTPSHPSIISFDASFLYRPWLSLTRINSGAGFHVLNNCALIENQSSESENFKFKAQADGSGKGKSLPTVAKAPSRLRKWDTSKDCLNSQEQPVPKMLKVTTPVPRSANVRSVHPLNILESAEDIGSNRERISSAIVPVDNLGSIKQVIQERCQTRATEVEHNFACTWSEDGANHTTIKSPTGSIDPPCDALNDLSIFLV